MLNQLIERSRQYDEHKSEYGPAKVAEHSFDPQTAELIVPSEGPFENSGVMLATTDWAFGQICQKLGPAAFPGTSKGLPREYMLACPPELRAEQLNHWVENTNPRRRWYVRGYDNTARAVLSDRYATIGVTETLEWIKEALDSKLGSDTVEFVRGATVTPDELHLRIVWKTVRVPDENSPYGFGGYFSTGEIGQRRLVAAPLVWRHACLNSLIPAKDEFSFSARHVGNLAVLKTNFIAGIWQVLRGAAESLDKLLEAKTIELPEFGNYVDNLVKRFGWSEEVKTGILVGSEGSETMWGAIQGITAAARRIENPADQADMEMVAGGLLWGERAPDLR